MSADTNIPFDYNKMPFNTKKTVSDQNDGKTVHYVENHEIRLAVDVAFATGRPLLLQGDPGLGKSTFARWMAANLGWRFYKFVVTSRTSSRDLLYEWDAIRRLSDAQGREEIKHPSAYVVPGPFWWAVDQESARKRGQASTEAEDPSEEWSRPDWQKEEVGDSSGIATTFSQMGAMPTDGAILLIDEIDKAEVNLPNDLLDPLDLSEFSIPELGEGHAPISLSKNKPGSRPLLVIITTNDERDLPPAFTRRCVVYRLKMPDKAGLVEIAQTHFSSGEDDGTDQSELYATLADKVIKLRDEMEGENRRPGTAEYVDVVRTCIELGIRPAEVTELEEEVAEHPTREKTRKTWEFLEDIALRKNTDPDRS